MQLLAELPARRSVHGSGGLAPKNLTADAENPPEIPTEIGNLLDSTSRLTFLYSNLSRSEHLQELRPEDALAKGVALRASVNSVQSLIDDAEVVTLNASATITHRSGRILDCRPGSATSPSEFVAALSLA